MRRVRVDGGVDSHCAPWRARRRLVTRYGIDESETTSLLVACCCAPLARHQEMDTVMAREHLVYGCAAVVPVAAVMLPPPPVPAIFVLEDAPASTRQYPHETMGVPVVSTYAPRVQRLDEGFA